MARAALRDVMRTTLPVPASGIDLFADEVFRDPCPALRKHRRGLAALPVRVRTGGQ